jgi:hypothetical protein
MTVIIFIVTVCVTGNGVRKCKLTNEIRLWDCQQSAVLYMNRCLLEYGNKNVQNNYDTHTSSALIIAGYEILLYRVLCELPWWMEVVGKPCYILRREVSRGVHLKERNPNIMHVEAISSSGLLCIEGIWMKNDFLFIPSISHPSWGQWAPVISTICALLQSLITFPRFPLASVTPIISFHNI